MKGDTKIGVIILAAGSSSRLGYPKQLVEFRGKSLLQHSIDVADSLHFDVQILLMGAKAGEILKKIECRNFEIVINDNWKEGIGTSISKGIFEALHLQNDLDYVLILLSDQPFITTEKIREIIRVKLESKKSATFSEYLGEAGVPAIFSKETFSDLQELKKDQGAKKLILKNRIEFELVKFEGGNFDVDTAADVDFLKRLEEE
ncbi:nucleotidyltransferase family protein [Salegentibacter sp. F188]|uniref:Nucleotidyltransferase family protein n=1 Tax=Autumnicola patrickiae TaxID=3075591 RepID=A0ABU3E577_9FLAO|nr:nucleotidyltransferase family protein [Salegentibacter sp. F188]MDT0691143.1 nucleotidyltransferase family protein [Salegentibacter sp. F188]